MSTMRPLARDAIKSTVQILEASGWVRDTQPDDEVVTLEREQGRLVHQFALLTEVRDFGIWFNPTLAVREPEVMRLASEFIGLPDSGAAIFGNTLATVMGSQTIPLERWLIEVPSQASEVVERLTGDFLEYGPSFYSQFNTLDDVAQSLMSRGRMQYEDGYLAIALALSGRPLEAAEIFAAYVEEARGQRPPMATQSWRFIENYRAHFGVD